MNTPDPLKPVKRSFRSLLFNRSTILAFVAGAAFSVSVGVVAPIAFAAAWHGTNGAADVDMLANHMLRYLYAEIKATDAQKAEIDPRVKQALDDLLPLEAQVRTAHQHAIDVLTDATLDRSALEAARVEHMQLADQASKRVVQLIGDVDDVLTPEQRKKLSDHLKRLHDMKHL